MRYLERSAFFDDIALVCVGNTVIDLRITTYSETLASFKGVMRPPAPTSKAGARALRTLLQRASAPPSSPMTRVALTA